MNHTRTLRRSALAVVAAATLAGAGGVTAMAATPHHAGANQRTGAQTAAQPALTALTGIAAVVGADGTIARAKAGTTVVLPNGSADGNYRVDFKKVINGCVYTAVLGTTSIGVSAPGYATVASDAASTKGVFVETFNSSGALTPNAFHLVVTC